MRVKIASKDTFFPTFSTVDESIFEVDMADSLADIETPGKLEGRFKKFFKVADDWLKRFTMVLSVANTACLGFKLYRDFKDDAPMYQKVLDGLQVSFGIKFNCYNSIRPE